MAKTGTDIEEAARLLKNGNVVGIPTETVYGLAANALNPGAVARIFEVKKRPSFDPLIVHIHSLNQVKGLIQIENTMFERVAEKFWPGPLTILVKKTSAIPDLVTSGLPRVALRIPQHPLTRSLLSILNFPLAAPSANPFGYISPTTVDHVIAQLGKDIPYVLDGGPATIGVESTILDLDSSPPAVLRMGGISVEDLQSVIGEIKVNVHSTDRPESPGTLSSHYAPRIPLILGNIPELLSRFADKKCALLSFEKRYSSFIPEENQLVLSELGNLNEAARNLFATLRILDTLPVDYILAEYMPNKGLGMAINDRLRRASAG